MTEEIGSDKHRSSPEIKMAVMEERLREARKNDQTIMAQLDIIIGKISKVETSTLMGERRFMDLESTHRDLRDETSESFKAIASRVDALEKAHTGAANKVIGGVAVVAFLVSAWTFLRDILKIGGGQ